MTPANTPFVRPVSEDDLDALLALAHLAGGGMTNLPPDRAVLAEKIAWSQKSLDADITAPDNEYYMVVLEDAEGQVIGTASLFSRLGAIWPFYSYKTNRVTHVSRDLGRTFSTRLLHLVNDFDGASEVGGLFLHPDARNGHGYGAMLARSRYLFIALHRARFAERLVAELRGWVEDGQSPFWQAVAGPFFGGDFAEADLYNAVHGNQFIADLMPRYPIYITMLPTPAREAIGRPHPGSAPAMKMLLNEGFIDDGYCDIFDGGPTIHARTEAVATIRDAQIRPDGTLASAGLVAQGQTHAFRVWREGAA